MRIVLTGGTGFIGGAVLRRLLEEGHEVTAVVRSDSAADRVQDAGATPVVGDLFDTAWVAGQLARHDAAIHTAATSTADDAAMNAAVIDAVEAVYAGTPAPYLHTGGIWTYGSNDAITEDSPDQPIALTGWRLEQEHRLLGLEVRATVVRPGIVYGYGGGSIPTVLVNGPRTDDGALTLIGSGEQHWSTIHVDDLADLYVRLLDASPGREVYLGANGQNPTVRELGEAYATAVVPETDAEARARFGDYFAEALLLDQQAGDAKARATGWTPTRPSFVELLAAGYPADR